MPNLTFKMHCQKMRLGVFYLGYISFISESKYENWF